MFGSSRVKRTGRLAIHHIPSVGLEQTTTHEEPTSGYPYSDLAEAVEDPELGTYLPEPCPV